MNIKKYFILGVLSSALLTGILVASVGAESAECTDAKKESAGNFKEITKKCGTNETGGGESSSVPATVRNIINALLYIAGIAAVVIIVIGGIRFVTSEGDAQKTAKARDVIVNAVIGLVLGVLAYAAVNFVLGQFS